MVNKSQSKISLTKKEERDRGNNDSGATLGKLRKMWAFAHLGSNRRQGLVLMAVARKERKKQGVYCVLGSQVNGTFSGEPRN